MRSIKDRKIIFTLLIVAVSLALTGCVKISLPEPPEFAPPTPTPMITPKPTPAPTLLPLPEEYKVTPTPAPTPSPTPVVTGDISTEPGEKDGKSGKGKDSPGVSSSSVQGKAYEVKETPKPATPAPKDSSSFSSPGKAYDTPVISISGETLPPDQTQGKVCDLRGNISTSCGYLTDIYAALLDENGSPVQDCSYYSGFGNFSLAGTVNASLGFSHLKPGDYIYYLSAAAVNGDKSVENILIQHSFTVSPIPTSGGGSSGVPAAEPSGGSDNGSTGGVSAKYTDDSSTAGVIWNYFVNTLGNSHAAAAILANINAESSCVPIRVQSDFSSGFSVSQDFTGKVDRGEIGRDGFANGTAGEDYGNGYGLCQWTYERKAELYDFAKARGTSVGDLDTQCAFIMYEMENDYPKLLSYLKNATDTAEATLEFCNVYEQAGVKTGRTAMAKEFYEKYG